MPLLDIKTFKSSAIINCMNKKNREVLIRSALRNFPCNAFRTSKSLFYMMQQGEIAYPYKLTIESTAICNLKCTTCPQNYMKREKGHLKFALFKNIYDDIKPPYVNLSGFGEPLLNPDLFKIISYAKKHGSFVKVDTNGMLLNNDNINRLLNTGIDIISNSIDGMDKKTYESIRKGAKFETVIKNLKNLVAARNRKKSKTEIHIYLVLQKKNFKQFPDFIRFGDSIGVDSISGCFVKEESYAKNKEVNLEKCDKGELGKLALDLREIKGKTKANLEIDEILDDIANWEERKKKNWNGVPCYMPWYAPFVTWDGTVCPCCLTAADKQVIVGEASKEKFMNIWNGEKMKNFRRMVAIKRSGCCGKCELDESYIREQFGKIPFSKLLRKIK